MLRISQSGSSEGTAVLRLEGRLVGPWVSELERACEEAVGLGLAVQLDLADVEYMDGPGVKMLTRLRSRGVVLLACPPFAAEQLRTSGGG